MNVSHNDIVVTVGWGGVFAILIGTLSVAHDVVGSPGALFVAGIVTVCTSRIVEEVEDD